MSYNVDELFEFKETEGGYALARYLKWDDPSITELEIPAEYNGLPVVKILSTGIGYARFLKRVKIPESVRGIMGSAFHSCPELCEVELSEGLEMIGSSAFQQTKLKAVTLPKSLTGLYWGAFRLCRELEHVEFGGSPWFGTSVFSGCPKLPPETIVMSLVRSTDITRPISNKDISEITANIPGVPCDCFRRDVFELLVKNRSFRDCNLKRVFEGMINNNRAELFPIAEQYGFLPSAKILDKLISYSAERQAAECTAYLLELKKSKFGFDGGDDFEL